MYVNILPICYYLHQYYELQVCLCVMLSHPQVHPNHTRPPHLKLKHFEFAGRLVGKCLYESAMGTPLLVKARFTRSFLAQIIGLRINYRVCASSSHRPSTCTPCHAL